MILACIEPLFLHLIIRLDSDNRKKVTYYCAECLMSLEKPQQFRRSLDYHLNEKPRPLSNVSELAINDVEGEIRNTVQKYASVTMTYSDRSKDLLPGDILNGSIYKNLFTTKTSIKPDQHQITITPQTDGAPVTKV